MKENSPGLYLPDGSFISKEEIQRKHLMEGKAQLLTDMPLVRDFKYWGERFEQRQAQYKETESRSNKIEISFDQEPIINFIGDLHVGSPDVDYKRINNEIEIISQTPNSYLMVMGDTVDGFFFNPAQFEQIEQAPEQFRYINSIFEKMSKEGKLLVAWGGDHCGWAKKSGIDPYEEFSQRFNAYYMQGVGYVKLKVGETDYNLIAAHRLPGFSMYNNAHAEMRLGREVQGGDIYLAAHSHAKGFVQQEVQQFGGESKLVSYISLGPYKSQDDYSRKRGFAPKTEKGMYGSCIKLYKDHRQIKYYDSILEGNGKRLTRIEKGWIL
jgi:predicted MPP superfamily phosphohydrolase